MSEASERIETYSCIAPSAARDGDMLSVFPRLTRITGCFAASAARSRATPLISRASNTTTRFSGKSSSFCNFTPGIHQKRSQKVRNPKFSWGSMPPDPPACILCALKSHTGTLRFKILDPPLILVKQVTGQVTHMHAALSTQYWSCIPYLLARIERTCTCSTLNTYKNITR